MMKRVLILAAGIGKRFRRHTSGPKALVNFQGRPLIEHILYSLKKCDFHEENIAVVSGFEREHIEPYFCKVFYNHSYATTNMVGSLYAARDFFDGSSDLIISYSDIVYEPRIIQSLCQSKGHLVISSDSNWRNLWRLRMENYLLDIESFDVNESGELIEIGEPKPNEINVKGQYIGLIKVGANLQRNFVLEIEKCFSDSPENISHSKLSQISLTEFLQRLIKLGWKIDISSNKGGWLEFDTEQDLVIYERNISKIPYTAPNEIW